MANATDVNGDPLTASIVAGPAHGTVTQNPDGTWTYTPTGYFYGTDSFSYVVNDGTDNSNVATVTLNVAKVEIAPTLANSSANLNELGSTTLYPLANATDVNGDPLAASIVAGPAHGTVTQNADGTWTYTPTGYFYGTDTFTYVVNDGTDNSNVATVTLNVAKVEIAPTLANGSANLNELGSTTLDPLANATDVNGDSLTASIVTGPAHGTVTQNADGTWTYTPTGYFYGTDTFSYVVNDGTDNSNVATVTLNVAKVEIAPTLANSSASLNELGSTTLNPLANATDVNGDPLTASIVAGPTHGTVTQNADGTWTYTPTGYSYGTDTFSYVVNDGTDNSNVATVTLNVAKVEIAPTLVNGSANLNELGSTTLNPLANATDVNGDPLAASIVTGPAHGIVTQNADGTWTYTPTGYFYGTDSFSYVVNDGTDNSNVATVTLNVAKVEIAPTLTDSSANLNELGSTTLNPLNNATDVNGDPLTASIVAGPAHGTVTQNADGTWTYTPTGYFYGTDTFTYIVSDGTDNSNVATVTLNVAKVEIAPTLANSSASLDEDGNTVLKPLAAATDVNGDPLTASVVTQPAHGKITVNADGTWTYTPNQYFYGTDTFTYSVSDGIDSSNVATVTLNVNKVEIAPTAANSTVTGTENTPIVFTWGNFAVSDVNNDPLAVVIGALPAAGQLQSLVNGQWTAVAVGASFSQASIAAGNLRFVPAQYASGGPGYSLTGYGNMHQTYAAFGYTVTDGVQSSNPALVNIDITAVATAPTLTLGATSTTTQLFDSGFEDAPGSSNKQPVFVTSSTLDGWSVVSNGDDFCGNSDDGDDSGFEVWASGDQMDAANGKSYTVSAASGDGSKFLELSNTGYGYDYDQGPTFGITRQVNTVAGAAYSLSFDLAGSLGATSSAVNVLLDGKIIATYDPTSPNSALNWQHANISFTGSGGTQIISIVAARNGQEGDGRYDGYDDEGSSGTMLDNIALNQTQTDNVGNQGSTIALQSISAALVDTDGSETLDLVLSGMPVGTTLSDGTHSVTTTAANPSVDISGWNTAKLAITPPAGYSGTLTLQATATAAETVGGSKASVSQALTVQVNALAQTPSLTLNPPGTSVSRSLIATSWEGVCDTTYSATVLDTTSFAGWHTMPVAKGKDPAFEIWGNGDLMQNAQGKYQSVNDASGAGQEWLGLTNGVGSKYQAPGIAQSVNTIAGAKYTFTLDYAGQLGLTSANTQIGVYLDGTLLGTYSNTSTNGLNWQALSYSFQGDGASHTLSVQLINGTNTSTPRGAMIDALNLVETLPESASTVYGFAGSAIALPKISDQLAATDMGDLETTLVGLPVGATVTDGKNSATVTASGQVINVSGWNLNSLSLTAPNGYNNGDCGDDDDGGSNGSGTINLQVVATSVEPANGSMASIAKNVTVQLLSGQACATPAGVNPYVSYANSQATTQSIASSTGSVVASALVPVASSYAIVVPGGANSSNSTAGQQLNAKQLGASLESLLENLSQQVGVALRNEIGSGK